MSKFREIIVRSINLIDETFVNINNEVRVMRALDIYLVPIVGGTHERYVVDQMGNISKQTSGATGDFIPLTGTVANKPVSGDIQILGGKKFFKNPDVVTEDESTTSIEFSGANVITTSENNQREMKTFVNPFSFLIEPKDKANGIATQFSFHLNGGLSSVKDFTGINNPLAFIQQKYVDEQIENIDLQSTLNNGGIASSTDANSEFHMDLENSHFSSVQKANDLRTSIDQYPSSINIDAGSNDGSSRIVVTRNATNISQGSTGLDIVNVTLDSEAALHYANDYSSKFTDRSLVDKGFVKSLVTGVYKVKGSVADKDALDALTDMQEGDVYNLLDTGANYVYVLDLNDTGEAGWDDFFGSVDLSSINLQTVLNNGSVAYGDASMSTYLLKPADQGGFSNILFSQKNGFGSKYVDLEMFTPSTDFGGESYFSLRVKNLPDAVFSVIMKDNALEYADDYSAYYNDRSLVDKGWVNQQTTLQGILNNGTYAESTDANNSIDLSLNGGSYEFTLASATTPESTAIIQRNNRMELYGVNGDIERRIQLTDDNGIENSILNPNGEQSIIQMYPTTLSLAVNDISNSIVNQILIELDGTKVLGNLYNINYVVPGNDNYYVQKKYVDDATSSLNYLPLSGTEVGKPLTGNIAVNYTNFISGNSGYEGRVEFVGDSVETFATTPNSRNSVRVSSESVTLRSDGFSDSSWSHLQLRTNLATIRTEGANSRGLSGYDDYTANIEDLDYVQKKYVDNANKGLPDSDDFPDYTAPSGPDL